MQIDWASMYLMLFTSMLGPELLVPTKGHSMVKLANGQAIIGGFTASQGYSSKIYFYTCSNQNCNIKLLSKELPVPNALFVAIAIPDELSNCITNGKELVIIPFLHCK